MRTVMTLIIVGAALAGNGCGGKKAVNLDVDLYLHPEATTSDDLLLQAAVRKRLTEAHETQSLAPHVRVVQGVVFLSGAVKSEDYRQLAERIARTTIVRVNDVPIPLKAVQNHLIVNP